MYIDIRGNSGGHSTCYRDLFKMILNETLTPNHDNIKCYFKMTKFNSEEAIYRFAKKLRRLGIDAKLESLGAEAGDQVRILDFYFDYKD